MSKPHEKIFPAFRRQGVKLSRSRKKLAAAVSYREGVYDRTGGAERDFFRKGGRGVGSGVEGVDNLDATPSRAS